MEAKLLNEFDNRQPDGDLVELILISLQEIHQKCILRFQFFINNMTKDQYDTGLASE